MVLAAGVLLVAALSACGSKTAAPLELTSKDSGSQQTLAVGQQLKITLDANPTTGYLWAVDAVPDQLEQSGDPVYSSRSGAMGAGGTEVWTFVGKSAGTRPLKLKYWRSFEPTAAPAKAFEVTVDVR